MPNSSRPVKLVKFSPSDTQIVTSSPGGGTRFFKEVTSEFRTNLISQIDNYLSTFHQDVGIMVVEIESEALAKSHRPDSIFDGNSCPFIGDIGIDPETKKGKFLIRSTASGLSSIRYKIQNLDADYFEKALSTISKLENFSPELNLEELSDASNLLIKLIDFKNDIYNENKLRKYNEIISMFNIESHEISFDIGIFYVKINESNTITFLNTLIDNALLMSAKSANLINFRPLSLLPHTVDLELPSAEDDKEYPVVGVVDTCIKGECIHLSSWYEGEITSIINEEKVYDHGTFVAGLITNSFVLNSSDIDFPRSQSKIFSVGVLSSEGANVHEIYDMLTRAQRERPDIKIWNLSLGASEPVELTRISSFAVMLDEFQRNNNCICVIAAGNIDYHNFRKWPPSLHEPINEQRISSPGDSVLGITVASIAQVDGIVRKYEPSIFSRSGPVANYVLKPDLCHFGGNHIENGPTLINLGVTSLGMSSHAMCAFGQDCGTSFATPLVSTVAANLWKNMGTDTPRHTIKGLLAHSARLRKRVDKDEKIYYGWGMPLDVNDFMFCNENEITIILEGEISNNKEIVGKLPFPIPESLRTPEGKVKGEFFMTVSYDPPLDSNRALEYCLVNIDVGLGEITQDNKFSGKIPSEGTGYEQDLINGKYKWSPVKVYHKKFPNGVDVENWKLQVKMLTRHGHVPDENYVQPFSVILTIRSLDPDAQIYNEMITLMNQYNWEVSNAINIEQRIQV